MTINIQEIAADSQEMTARSGEIPIHSLAAATRAREMVPGVRFTLNLPLSPPKWGLGSTDRGLGTGWRGGQDAGPMRCRERAHEPDHAPWVVTNPWRRGWAASPEHGRWPSAHERLGGRTLVWPCAP